eukprot:gnl/TRDRNA2_/TRDRNA2_123436_c0_seq1.p1 gnl/TRDRNA2_/TRDRNA2_123436_c0~~gnl/TRDRNA2_/TRDRNA2_123436_c0_seq1.p1  ORF type:complete len:103 (+),score=11.49 gnl/TRDRNA2_/TRDRNA2_123436_c0_seq1:41-349(+)
MSDFNAQKLANMAWAVATGSNVDASGSQAVARTAERRLDDFNTFEVANFASAVSCQSDEMLFQALVRAAMRHAQHSDTRHLRMLLWVTYLSRQQNLRPSMSC